MPEIDLKLIRNNSTVVEFYEKVQDIGKNMYYLYTRGPDIEGWFGARIGYRNIRMPA